MHSAFQPASSSCPSKPGKVVHVVDLAQHRCHPWVVTKIRPSELAQAVSSSSSSSANSEVLKGSWSLAEDRLLLKAVEMKGARNWKEVAELVPHRSDKQCRERFANHLKPTVYHGKWTPGEDELLKKGVARFGSKWSRISKEYFTKKDENGVIQCQRTPNDLKNRFNCQLKRIVEKERRAEEDAERAEVARIRWELECQRYMAIMSYHPAVDATGMAYQQYPSFLPWGGPECQAETPHIPLPLQQQQACPSALALDAEDSATPSSSSDEIDQPDALYECPDMITSQLYR